MRVIVAEKPSVAADIARVVSATRRRDGYWEGDGVRVTWAIGHLVGLAQPDEIRPEWRRWSPELLPMVPTQFPLVVHPQTKDQFAIVRRLLTARETREVVCATDAGREGELIFRFIYEAAACQRPALRLWISSLTPDAIRKGLSTMKPIAHYDNLADAARARSIADWLVGMNLSRAYTLATGERFDVGRVKTPSLAMVVAREIAIQLFKPEPYREVEARLHTAAGEVLVTYVRPAYDADDKPILSARLPADPDAIREEAEDADRVLELTQSGTAIVHQVEQTTRAQQPPLLFDLTELQRTANRYWGWSAQHTLNVAQELYERHKVLSYPRSDSRHLSKSVEESLEPTLAHLQVRYGSLLETTPHIGRLTKRHVNDAHVSDHHAIIPTATPPASLAGGSDGARLYDLVARRLLSAWQPDAVDALTYVDARVVANGTTLRFEAKGKSVVRSGWRAVDVPSPQAADETPGLPAGLRSGMATTVVEARICEKQTRPPSYFTEATLLSAMESAGASLDPEQAAAMRARGLGTPATRARMIEELIAKGYVARDGKSLRATEHGIALIQAVHPHVSSPGMTGEWEAALKRIEQGETTAEVVLERIAGFVRTTVREALEHGVAPRRPVRSRGPVPPVTKRTKRGASKRSVSK